MQQLSAWPRDIKLRRRERRDGYRVAGSDEAFFVALDLGRKPGGAWLCADHGKDSGGLDGAPFARFGVLQLDLLEDFRTHHFPDFGMLENFDVILGLDTAR